MISASLPGEGLAQLGQLSHLGRLYPPPAGMTPEFLPPPPRPHARYAPRAPARPPPPPSDPPSAAPAFPPVPGAYARFLPHPASYAPYLYRAPPPQPPQPSPAPLRLRTTGSGFVPPAPAAAPARSPPPPPPVADRSPPPAPCSPERARRPRHFCRGALIRLESGALRRVEDMRTEDFVSSAERCSELALTHCTLLRLEEHGPTLSLTLAYDSNRSQVEMESTVEHPFFVYGQGWASCAPERTLRCYGLAVRRLQVGDVCVSLVARPAARRGAAPHAPHPPHPPPQSFPENLSVKEDARKRRWSAPDAVDDDPLRPPAKKR